MESKISLPLSLSHMHTLSKRIHYHHKNVTVLFWVYLSLSLCVECIDCHVRG